jgi:L-ascorbate metabolism protein UlaG (beta-lactamase superfamily)
MKRITYVGHATVLIDLDGVRILTDPLLGRWAGPLRRYAPPPDLDAVRAPDVVLLSHMHIDHVDRGSLRLIDRRTTVLTPAPGKRLVESLGFRDVRVVSPGDSLLVHDVRIDVLPARHGGRRHPLARGGEAVGYVMTAAADRAGEPAAPGGSPAYGPRAVYFPGDTACFDEMAALAGAIDVALLPIWGWGVSVDEDNHLTPLAAAKCLSMLQPRLVVPIHWGTYAPPAQARLAGFDPLEPPRAFARYVAHLQPKIELVTLQPGESTVVQGRDNVAALPRGDNNEAAG